MTTFAHPEIALTGHVFFGFFSGKKNFALVPLLSKK